MIKIREGSSARWEMFGQIDPGLGQLFYKFVEALKMNGAEEVIITSIIRPKENDSGVHEAGRGIDMASIYPKDVTEKICNYINQMYPYDISRPNMKSIIHHKTNVYNDNNWHFHLQVRA